MRTRDRLLRMQTSSQKHQQVQAQLFEWRPLASTPQQFRLLKLLPSKGFKDVIRCTIVHSYLQEKLEYEALSYVWGDPKITARIFIEGQPLDVTTNLEVALRYIRHNYHERVLWIDAICINQRDIAEKNHQVMQMRAIYLGAKQVLVWLGEEGTAKRALKLCTDWKIYGDAAIRDFNNFKFGDLARISDDDFLACHDIFRGRAWWQRIWVVQEVYHNNPAVVCIGHIQV